MNINDLKCPDMSSLSFKERDEQLLWIVARHRKLQKEILRNSIKMFEASDDANDIAEIIINQGRVPKAISNCSNKDIKQQAAKYFIALANLYYENLEKQAEYRKEHPLQSAGQPIGMRSDSDWDRGISRCCCNGNCGCNYPI